MAVIATRFSRYFFAVHCLKSLQYNIIGRISLPVEEIK